MLAESVPYSQVGRAFGFHRAGDTLGAVAGPLATLSALSWFGPSDATYRMLFLLTLIPGLAAGVAFGFLTKDPDERRRLPATPSLASGPPMPAVFNRFLVGVAFFGLADFAPTPLPRTASATCSRA